MHRVSRPTSRSVPPCALNSWRSRRAGGPKPLGVVPLIDQLTGRATAPSVTLDCLSIDETYCEKIISYLRRATEHLVGRSRSQYEERLARHVYDVHQIGTQGRCPPGHAVQSLFAAILAGDVAQFGQRIDGFRADPAGTLRRTLGQIVRRAEFREHYERFVAELVYGERRPDFDEAFGTFSEGAGALLEGLDGLGEAMAAALRWPRPPLHARPADVPRNFLDAGQGGGPEEA